MCPQTRNRSRWLQFRARGREAMLDHAGSPGRAPVRTCAARRSRPSSRDRGEHPRDLRCVPARDRKRCEGQLREHSPPKGMNAVADHSTTDSASSIDNRHLLLVGAGPGLGMAVARRFPAGGYRVALVALGTDGLRDRPRRHQNAAGPFFLSQDLGLLSVELRLGQRTRVLERGQLRELLNRIRTHRGRR